jgi:tetratricopeptide (TPR) repeat protein
MRRRAPGLLLTLLLATAALLAPTPVSAGDAEAERLIREAYDKWKDPTPDAALSLAEQALAAAPASKHLKARILMFIVGLHQVKTGKTDAALGRVDEVLALLRDDPDQQAKKSLAEALLRKASMVYAEKEDPDGALQLYAEAQQTHHLGTTADSAAQMCLRVGRDPKRPAEDKARWMELALALSREAVDAAAPQPGERGAEVRAKARARFLVTLANVYRAHGNAEEADATFDDIDQSKLDDNANYQLAVWWALQATPAGQGGEAGARAAAYLKKAMALRPVPVTRNQLRKFIRTEPDFAPLLERDDWKGLVTDEPETATEQGSSPPGAGGQKG